MSSFETGYETGPIALDNVLCVGTEDRLVDCPSGVISSVCSHLNNARVRCLPRTGKIC